MASPHQHLGTSLTNFEVWCEMKFIDYTISGRREEAEAGCSPFEDEQDMDFDYVGQRQRIPSFAPWHLDLLPY